MELPLSPETEARLNELANLRGCDQASVVAAALADYFEKIGDVRQTLDRRYDEMMNGTVKMLSPEEFWENFEARKAEWLAKKGR